MDCREIQYLVHEGCDQGNCSPAIDLHQLQTLFQTAAFWAKDRRIEDWAIALANSKPIVSAWDGSQLVGFARAISDGIYRATIWDVVIDSSYRGAGLGRKLVETVLMHPHVNRAERVYLMTTHQQKFYERIGFEQNSTTTMVLYSQRTLQEGSAESTEARPELRTVTYSSAHSGTHSGAHSSG
jgi:N-acetylglutamate synthase-like GNAT family acetyltransferase